MPKPITFPTLYNEVLQINISKLKEWGYLQPHRETKATYNWSRNGTSIGKISIHINTVEEQPFIILDYSVNKKPKQYSISLVSVPSNLGNSFVWYFLCPETNKHCRILYLVNGRFLHREAFTGCMYESQVQSKKYRQLEKSIGAYFKIDNVFKQLERKHFKKFYSGKPTKKYLKLSQQLKQYNSISHEEIERELLS